MNTRYPRTSVEKSKRPSVRPYGRPHPTRIIERRRRRRRIVYNMHAKVILNFQISYTPTYYIIVTPLARWVPSGNSIRTFGVRASLTHTHTHTSTSSADRHNLMFYVPLRMYSTRMLLLLKSIMSS